MVARKSRSPSRKTQATFSPEEELQAYREMLLIRRFEEKAGQMYGMGLIGGFCHLYIGQEAVVVGMQMALEDGDQVSIGGEESYVSLCRRHWEDRDIGPHNQLKMFL